MNLEKKIKILSLLILVAIPIDYFFCQPSAIRQFNLNIPQLLPSTINGWESRDLPISEELLGGVGSDSEVWRRYVKPGQKEVDLWLSFYGNQIIATAHNPGSCYNAQGWTTEKLKDSVVLPSGETLNMTKVILRKGPEQGVSFYWYLTSGRVAETEFKKNINKFIYGITENRADLLFFRVSRYHFSTDMTTNEIELKEFIKTFYPQFINNLPERFL